MKTVIQWIRLVTAILLGAAAGIDLARKVRAYAREIAEEEGSSLKTFIAQAAKRARAEGQG